MPPTCDECGSHDMQRVAAARTVLEECGLCGHVQGDPRAVAELHEERTAAELGVSVELLGLLDALDAIPGLAVDRSLSQIPADLTPPAIFFQLRAEPLEVLDRLTRTLVLARRRLHHLWTVEASHQGRLLFVLRPRLFHEASQVDAAEGALLQDDVRELRDSLRRDRHLPWWDLPR